MYAAGDGQAPAREGGGAFTSTLPVPPRSSGRRPHPGGADRGPPPRPAAVPPSLCSLPNFPAPTARRAPGPAPLHPVPSQARPARRGCPGRGRRARVGSPRPWAALAGLATKPRQDGPFASSWHSQSAPAAPRAPAGPAPPGAAGHTSPRPPAPGASPRANFAGRGAEVGAGGRPCPAAPRPHRPPARPLTFHRGEQRQQQQRGPQPPQGHGCASRGLGPRRRGARAAARAPGSGGRGERRGAAHTQPPPPRSQQNEPSSPGRTGTRAPPALGTAHLSRGRGGRPARPPPPARARDPSWPRAPPESQPPPRSRGPPGGGAGAGVRRPRAQGRRRPRAPPAQQWSLPALWLLQIKQRFQPKCF